MYGAKSIIDSFASSSPHEKASELDEGLGSIATSKLADLARGFILKARPIIVLHNPEDDSTVTLKLKRGLVRHTLSADEDGRERTIDRSISASILLTKALNEVRKYVSRGYVEI